MLSFLLTMPNNSSWNGKWSGDDDLHYAFRKSPKQKEVELNGKNFYYDFGDGWGANIKVECINAKEKSKRAKKSVGFASYSWMIDEILQHGRILTLQERLKMK